MEVSILEEHGYENAIRGLAYSFKDRANPVDEWWTEDKFTKMIKTANSLVNREGGHNKWLESVMLWIDIEAPRYWWSEFDTYRVGMTKQSESTMHTLRKRDVTQEDFEMPLPPSLLDAVNIERHNSVEKVKAVLPESYLQRRMVVTNYKCLRNIIFQRHDHKLKLWQYFCEEIYLQSNYPELLPPREKLK